MGTVPGTVPGVVRTGTPKATGIAILAPVFPAITMASLDVILAGVRGAVQKVFCLVKGKAIAGATAKATVAVTWMRTCGAT